MIYNGQHSPTLDWPSTVQYPTYRPTRRLRITWLLASATVLLTLSVAALIIVFAVEHSWFQDSFNQTNTNQYGLWRLCFFSNNTCDSWFSTSGPISYYIDQRLNQARVGINAWQALEIVFIFLTTSTLIITVASITCYRFRKNFHYYLAVLAVFCVWPAASVGVSTLFVFGFAVYNYSTSPRSLDWCFYVNLVAVILSVISAILLTIYNIFLKKPVSTDGDDTIIETFADFNGHSATLSPSTFVVVRRNKKKRMQPYDYPRILYPNHYLPTTAAANGIANSGYTNNDYVTNPNHQMLAPYTSGISNQQTNHVLPQQKSSNPYRHFDYNRPGLLQSPSMTSMAPQPRSYQPPVPPYNYQQHPSPAHWHRTGGNVMNQPMSYNSPSVNDYIQRGIYRPTRLNPNERIFEQKEQPRVLHYYTGYDHFTAVDPADVILTRHHPPLPGPGSPVRYTVNPSYYQQNDY